MITDRIPPQALDVERCVLGSAMVVEQASADLVSYGTEGMFYNTGHRLIFKAILSLFNRQQHIDIITVSERLRGAQVIDQVGGDMYLSELVEHVATSPRIDPYLRILEEKRQLRQLIQRGSEIVSEAFSSEESAQVVVDRAQGKILEVGSVLEEGRIFEMGELCVGFAERMDAYARGELQGLNTGLSLLDEKTGGLQRQNLVILAGRPSMGKTALALTAALNIGKAGKHVVLFSCEQGRDELCERLICMDAELSMFKLRTGTLEKMDYHKTSMAMGHLDASGIRIVDRGAITTAQIRAFSRRVKAKDGLDLIIVDYLQLMGGSGEESRQQEISNISRGLKAIAKDLDVPVLALSQLSRAVENRADKMPLLSDLRDSGAIEQDADVVIFMYRPEYYRVKNVPSTNRDGTPIVGADGSPVMKDSAGVAYAHIAKQRNGPTGDVELNWNKETMRFSDAGLPVDGTGF